MIFNMRLVRPLGKPVGRAGVRLSLRESANLRVRGSDASSLLCSLTQS